MILANPAPLILHTNMISFEVLYKGAVTGRAYINPLDLYPGKCFSISKEVETGADPDDLLFRSTYYPIGVPIRPGRPQ